LKFNFNLNIYNRLHNFLDAKLLTPIKVLIFQILPYLGV
jgi:hypothetical protein